MNREVVNKNIVAVLKTCIDESWNCNIIIHEMFEVFARCFHKMFIDISKGKLSEYKAQKLLSNIVEVWTSVEEFSHRILHFLDKGSLGTRNRYHVWTKRRKELARQVWEETASYIFTWFQV